MSNENKTASAFIRDPNTAPPEFDLGGEYPICPLSMASGEPLPCHWSCVACPPYQLWRIAERGIVVDGEITSYSAGY